VGLINIQVVRSRGVLSICDYSLHNVSVHHHALEFPNGQIVLVTHLCEGERLSVLQLPAAPRTENKVEERKPSAVVV
jgi:hypothetical protein